MNSDRIAECTRLSEEILKNFELSELPVSKIILKCLRLCRLLNDEDGVLLFLYESSGYPETENQLLTADAWRISKLAGRRHFVKEKIDGVEKNTEYAKTQLIAEFEELIDSAKIRLAAANDPNVSLSSANPNQYVGAPVGNFHERRDTINSIKEYQKWIQRITGSLYNYILNIYNNLIYGNIVEDTFTNARLSVNSKLEKICPEAIRKFVSVYDNMESENPEDWANAIHSCRRILLDLADVLYPPRDEPITIGKKTIQLGPENYINRLVQFIDSKSSSNTFKSIVGADHKSIGARIDAIYNATNKGTHSEVTKEEASRYLVHTYFLISDIISLMD